MGCKISTYENGPPPIDVDVDKLKVSEEIKNVFPVMANSVDGKPQVNAIEKMEKGELSYSEMRLIAG